MAYSPTLAATHIYTTFVAHRAECAHKAILGRHSIEMISENFDTSLLFILGYCRQKKNVTVFRQHLQFAGPDFKASRQRHAHFGTTYHPLQLLSSLHLYSWIPVRIIVHRFFVVFQVLFNLQSFMILQYV